MKKVRFEKKKYTYLDSLRFSVISSPVCTILYLILSLAVAILPTCQVIINARFIDNALGLIDGSATKRAVYHTDCPGCTDYYSRCHTASLSFVHKRKGNL